MTNSSSSSFELLGEHVPAECDAALEGHRCEIRALSSLGFSPGKQRRNKPRYAGANKSQEPEVGADSLNSTAVFRAVRAEMKQLNDTGKIVAGRRALNSCDVLHLSRKRMLDGSRDQGTAIRHEELQQENH